MPLLAVMTRGGAPWIAVVAGTVTLAGCIGGQTPESVGEASVPVAVRLVAFEKVHGPEEIAAIVDGFTALPGVAVKVIGESVESRPLHAVVLGTGPFELWIVGRHHGNEPTGAEAILQAVQLLADPDAGVPEDAPPLLRSLREHREFLLKRVTFIFVPVVNPDGAAAFVRTNANGQDLNRDYLLFTQPEPLAIASAFWEHWPDACLDLHNEGLSDRFDWDAFAPVGLPESEVQEDVIRSSWRTVYEIDAAGGFGGGPNENYRLADEPPASALLNPTAYHPGTHDMFCSLRGAPGWTPEGAIAGASGSIPEDQTTHAWATRSHLVTIATAAFQAAGAYDGRAPVIQKEMATLAPGGAEHLLDVPVAGTVTIQAVWRRALPPEGALAPLAVAVEDPSGKSHVARLPTPEAYTASVRFEEAEAGTYTVRIQGQAGAVYELRSYLAPAQPPSMFVYRTADGLRVVNPTPHPVDVLLTDVMDPVPEGAAIASPPPARVSRWEGPVAPRMGLEWDLHLDAGGVASIQYEATQETAGPWRFTAERPDTANGVRVGVEAARSTA